MKKVIAIMGAALILLSLMASVIVPLTVRAEGTEDAAVTAAASSSGSSGSDDSDDPSDVSSGGLEVTGYELNDIASGDQKIHMDTRFTLVLHISDKRSEVVDALNKKSRDPQIRLNSSSFFIAAGADGVVTDSPPISNFKIKSDRVDYTVTYHLSYTGTGNGLECDIYYKGLDAVPYGTVSLTLNKVVEYVAPDSSDSGSDSTITRGTNFVVKSASYGTGTLAAGAPFKLAIEAMTTNGSYAVENVTATLALPKEITFTTGTSTVYVGTVAPNTTFNAVFDLMASAVAEEGSYTLTLTLNGVDSQSGEKVSDQTELTVPVYQPERFEILSKSIPDFITAGTQDMGYASVTLINKGIGDVYNVTLSVTGGDLYFADGEVYLGSIKGNSQSSADFVVMSNTPGEYNATLVVGYENSLGEGKSLTSDFVVTVSEGGGGTEEPLPVDELPEEPTGISPLVWVGVGTAAVAAGAVTVVVLAKRRKKKKDAALDDDYDEEEE